MQEEIESEIRIDGAEQGLHKTEASGLAQRSRQMRGFECLAEVQGADRDSSVVAQPQGRVAIERDRRIDDGTGILVGEIVRNVRSATAKTDPHWRTRPRVHRAFGPNRQMIARHNADEPPGLIEQRNDSDPMVEFLKQEFARSIRSRPDEFAIRACLNRVVERSRIQKAATDIAIGCKTVDDAPFACHEDDAMAIEFDLRERIPQPRPLDHKKIV